MRRLVGNKKENVETMETIRYTHIYEWTVDKCIYYGCHQSNGNITNLGGLSLSNGKSIPELDDGST